MHTCGNYVYNVKTENSAIVDDTSYKWFINREAVYKVTNKDYLPEAKPSKVKCIAHEHSECRQGIYWPE